MEKRILSALALLVILSTFSSAVVINEFTVDPQTDWDKDGSISTTKDEWFELFNDGNTTIDLTNWTVFLNDNTNATEFLEGTILPGEYLTILNPEGSQSNDGQLILYNSLDQLIDSVTYGDWDDGNESDNAPDGNANDYTDECLSRMPNAQDTDNDKNDFIKTRCTYGSENGITPPNEQSLLVTIAGRIVFDILPRQLNFGIVQPGSTDNPALNGPIIFNVTGSEQDVNVEITNVTGYPFEDGLRIDNNPALGSHWFIPYTSPIVNATPTLDVPEEAPPGQAEGTIVYTVTGPTP
ncbi:MAG: lamin tail domain-containing protein [Nanoarchaeota archaeon]|nr:lamin tail domain-containing protein [Nanoarchaeota archaeon]MBU1104142.1 lamin tail domain-containing protein [Nanoarchaeota archaeon]